MAPINPQRLQAQAEMAGLDALITCTPTNVQYATGYDTTMFRFLPGPSLAAIWRKEEQRATLILPAIRLPSVLDADLDIDLIPYGPSPFLLDANTHPALAERLAASAPTLLAGVQQAVRNQDVRHGRIGLDEGNLSAVHWKIWATALASSALEPAAAHWLAARTIKTEQEVDQMTLALRHLEASIEDSLLALAAGGSEAEINRLIRSCLALRGGFFGAGALCVGERGGAVLPPSDVHAAQPGDLVKWDVAGLFGGYWADTARTACKGAASSLQRQRFVAVEAAHHALLSAVRPGAIASELYRIGHSTMAQAGLSAPQMHVGHGIGLDLYEPPLLSPTDETVLVEGMVLCLENPIFEIAAGAFTLEDTVVVTADGCRVLNQTSRSFRTL